MSDQREQQLSELVNIIAKVITSNGLNTDELLLFQFYLNMMTGDLIDKSIILDHALVEVETAYPALTLVKSLGEDI